jgi:hypothetical protein
VFTARYALSPYIKQIRFVFKGLMCQIRCCGYICNKSYTAQIHRIRKIWVTYHCRSIQSEEETVAPTQQTSPAAPSHPPPPPRRYMVRNAIFPRQCTTSVITLKTLSKPGLGLHSQTKLVCNHAKLTSAETSQPQTPLRSALFWGITQCRRFGTTYRSHLQGSRIFLNVGKGSQFDAA